MDWDSNTDRWSLEGQGACLIVTDAGTLWGGIWQRSARGEGRKLWGKTEFYWFYEYNVAVH